VIGCYELVFLSADRPELLYSSLKEPDISFTLLSEARRVRQRAVDGSGVGSGRVS